MIPCGIAGLERVNGETYSICCSIIPTCLSIDFISDIQQFLQRDTYLIDTCA
ncbi:hypothetical protein C0J52_12792 [Blattella germanica]|nr:hypothetical protein C0J52_12792 [Blattella germanica]